MGLPAVRNRQCFTFNPVTSRPKIKNEWLRRSQSEASFAADEQGFGVPPNSSPLSLVAGDYSCGDTAIYQAIGSTNAPGGFKVQAFVLLAEDQPSPTARNTFQVAGDFLRDRPGEE